MTDIQSMANAIRFLAIDTILNAGEGHQGVPLGMAEIAATLDHMAAFAHLAGAVSPHLFDLYHEATLGDPATEAFLREATPDAWQAMKDRFAALLEAGLWQTRRNSIHATVAEGAT